MDLSEFDFEKIGQIQYGIPTELFWSTSDKIELSISSIADVFIFKGTKRYFVVAQGQDGRETYSRDLAGLLRYLEGHFPEAHLELSFFRDITVQTLPEFADFENDRSQLQVMSQEIESARSALSTTKSSLSTINKLNSFELTKNALNSKTGALKSKLETLKPEYESLKRKLISEHQLLRTYEKDGRAAVLLFKYCSPLFVSNRENLNETIEAVVTEVKKSHWHSIRQKLEGGQLQIYVEELNFPHIAYLSEWAGIFSPTQLSKLKDQLSDDLYSRFLSEIQHLYMTFPAKDVEIEGHVRHAKRLPAQAVREFLKKVKSVPSKSTIERNYPERGVLLGHVIENGNLTNKPYMLPLNETIHTFISGSTGSGKSFLARVLVEGAIAEGITTIIIDPRNQWCSLILSEDRDPILELYDAFGLDQEMARGFPIEYFTPGNGLGKQLPSDFNSICDDHSVVSFKELDKVDRCTLLADILEGIFQAHMDEERRDIQTLVVIEEAHLFTKQKADNPVEQRAVARAEDAINTLGRESRKYGLNLVLISQTIRDFRYSSSMIRQNTNTKIFMRNSDRELDYAADYLDDAESIVKLKTGEAIIYTAEYGQARIKVRPPFSKVEELSEKRLRQLLGRDQNDSIDNCLKSLENRLLELARNRIEEGYEPITMKEAMAILDVTSGRQKVDLVNSLEEKGLIRTEKLRKPGQPRIIIPCDKS